MRMPRRCGTRWLAGLKITDPRAAELGQGPSYQCPMVLTDTPQGGLAWPGSELLSALDDLAQDVDWAVRLRGQLP